MEKYSYKAVEGFWISFHALSSEQKERVRESWEIFKLDPFDSRLRIHKIHRLSALWKCTIYAVEVEGDLRVLFRLQGNEVITLDVGTHKIYRS